MILAPSLRPSNINDTFLGEFTPTHIKKERKKQTNKKQMNKQIKENR
jgi:hypothetical protein